MGPTQIQEQIESASPVAKAPKEKLRKVFPTYIRALAAFAVVQMHSIGGYLYQYGQPYYDAHQWWTADAYYALLRWATPFFVMLSGSFMLDPVRDEPIPVFLRKRVGRVMIPFLFWGVIYLLYRYRGEMYYGNPVKWQEVVDVVLFQDIYFHLWFIPMIAGMYLLTPVFRSWIRHARRSEIEYFLVICFVFSFLQHYTPRLIIIKYIGWLGYIGYYVLGFYLSNYTINWRRWAYILAILLAPLSVIGTWYATVAAGQYDDTYFIYWSPSVILASIALFTAMKQFNWPAFVVRYPGIHRRVERFSQLSFGVYFIHPLIIDVLKNGYLGVRITSSYYVFTPADPIYGGVLQAVTVTLLSFWIIAGLDRIPGMKKMLF